MLEQADRLFRGEVTKERMAEADRGTWPSAIWQAVEQAGLPLALVPEAQGGAGLPPADALRLIRRAGYHTLPVPLAETMIAAALWAEASGEAVEGTLSLAPAGTRTSISHRAQRARLRAARRGPARALGDAGGACARVRARRCRIGPPRAAAAREPASGATAPQSRQRAARHAAPGRHRPAEEAVRPAPPACAEGFLLFGALIRAQQMVGAMERCLDYALAYAMERQQFGRPIGKFQAVQHMLADAAGQYAAAAAAARSWRPRPMATPTSASPSPSPRRALGEAAGKVAEVCHQVHGAMGFTQEHPLHFATRRLWSWRDEFGHETFWQERIGRMVCSAGGEALWPMLVGDMRP